MYDYAAAIDALNQHWRTILPCLIGPVIFSYIYFTTAVRQAIAEKVYVEAFFSAAFFFWHDLSFVLSYELWFGGAYSHWWFKAWWFALLGTVAFEAYLIYQVYRYGHRELWPSMARPKFGALLVLGTLAIGALWLLIKHGIADDLFFVTFAVTAVIPAAPYHTALMVLRKNRAGQSVARQLCMAGNLVFLTAAFAQVSDFFLSPVYLAFASAFTLWPLVNIGLIRSLPPAPASGP
ncbi:MAG: hypothetical protein JWQ90_842 [Hydrocarboniphaga sp.]|uniref:hypothetical protein n=1 Tax=Hydrocarboniphaga sp. TaxID=2033016 RepID=UPI002605CD2A|nr:hypothetical protein [Hydrocarboniphaga sp.]MDB5968392.1 hypothetical protein [Hydrocarboniphaga sp.]